MSATRIIKPMAVFAIACAMAAMIAGCSGNQEEATYDQLDVSDTTGGVAATVTGVEIGANSITGYIEDFRSLNGLTEDAAWAEWMVNAGYTAEDLRSEVINYYVNQALVRQAAEENGVTVDSAEIDSQVETMKSNYEDEAAWDEALQSVGIQSEEVYRSELELYAMEQALVPIVAGDAEPSEEDLLMYAQMYGPAYDGAKKSSHILFAADDEATAQQVLDQINNGEIDFADAAAQYSIDTASAADGGNVGWDALNSFVTEYTDALSNLEEGQVSGLVTSDYGIHIIKCTEVFTCPEEVTSIEELPQELQDLIVDYVSSSAQDMAYQEWFSSYQEGADIVINDMPEGLPYDVDTSEAEAAMAASDTGAESADTATEEAPSDGAAADESADDVDAAIEETVNGAAAEESGDPSASTVDETAEGSPADQPAEEETADAPTAN